MNLLDLRPRWLAVDGKRVMFLFNCPHCPTSKIWLSCKSVPMAVEEQYRLIAENCEDLRDKNLFHEYVTSKPDVAWTITPEDFATMSVSPSIDASQSGHWHGWIKDGEIS